MIVIKKPVKVNFPYQCNQIIEAFTSEVCVIKDRLAEIMHNANLLNA
jgi:hypothetical protein